MFKIKWVFGLCSGVTILVLAFLFKGYPQEKNSFESEIDNVRAAISNISSTIDSILTGEYKICNDVRTLQECLYNSNIVVIPPGNYSLSKGLLIPSNIKLVIQKGATISLSDDADMPYKGGFVVGILGTEHERIDNVVLIHNGVIDGNRSKHPYERSGNEGIKIDYGNNITIFGDGIVQNASGDGVDFDVTNNSVLMGLEVSSNSGSGVHFGSGRPIKSSKNVQVIGAFAKNNGFKSERYGLDVSWPNLNAVTYGWSSSKNNYINWSVVGSGSEVFKGESVNGRNKDIFSGAKRYEVNGYYENQIFTNFDYTTQLIRRDVKFLLGRDVHDHLIPLKYNRAP